MENQRKNREPGSSSNDPRQGRNAPMGFEGMNFEEQRGSEKNSDGAGANWDGNRPSTPEGGTTDNE
jgi:hypothetical protein